MREKIPDYADVFTVEEFRGYCECGGFIDYDGYGHPVVDDMEDSSIVISPSSHVTTIPEWATHIAWYNR